jgi:Iap family predicted aminopeptidase
MSGKPADALGGILKVRRGTVRGGDPRLDLPFAAACGPDVLRAACPPESSSMVPNTRSPARLLAFCALTAVVAAMPAARADLSPEEQRLLDHLDARRALEDIRRISQDAGSAPSGLGAGTVVSGSPEEKALATDIGGSLRALGLNVRVEEFAVRVYRYGPVVLTANATAIAAISLQAAGGTWGSRDGVAYARGNEARGHRLRAPLIDAGDGYAPDYGRVGDVRGKVVLVRREMRDWPPAQITEAKHRGALALLFHDHPSSADQPDALRQDSMWGHDQLPTAAISQRAAEDLRRQLAGQPVEIVLENRADVVDGRSRNVVAMLRGAEFPDEWVVVSAHYDRWFRGAADNTSGAAALLEIAHAFARSGLRPRRSVLFVATGSEEAGLEDPERDWLAGSYALVARHPEILRRAALVFNIDLLGWTSPTATLISSPDVLVHQKSVLSDLGYDSTIKLKVPIGSVTDAWNYGVVGGAATSHLERLTPAYYPLYHTQMDVFRPERFSNMQSDLRLLTLSLWRAASARRLPIELTAVADYVESQLALDAAKVPDVSFANVHTAVADFRAAATAVEARVDPADADAVNRVLMATRHVLVPWLYASNGDFEQVVRTTEYANRVVAFDHAIAAARIRDRQAALTALGEFYEGRQCQRLSPEVYALERAYWAGDGGWASRFEHRAPPPLPAFESACASLLSSSDDPAALVATFVTLRSEAVQSIAQAVALMSAKLRVATAELQQFARGMASGDASPERRPGRHAQRPSSADQ